MSPRPLLAALPVAVFFGGMARAQPGPAAPAPSFDCARAAASSELAICRDPSLARLDASVAAAYARASGATQGPDAAALVSEQRVWLRQRNACQADPVCLQRSMTQRIAELLPSGQPAVPHAADEPGEGLDTRSAGVVRAWGLPTLLGLPYLPRVEQAGPGAASGASFGDTGRLIDLATVGLNQHGSGPQIDTTSPAVRGWTRLINAIGMALFPDRVAKLDDAATARLACLYLPIATPNPAGGRSCHDMTFAANGSRDIFALHDFAESARSTQLPALAASAPALPLRLLVTIPITLAYDLKAGQFTIGAPKQVSVFGSTADTLVGGLTWAPPVAQARALVEGQGTGGPHLGYLRLRLTLTGSTAWNSNATGWDESTGLPAGRRWVIEGDMLALFADSALTQKLQDFDQPRRLPLPVSGTARAGAPKPVGPVPLDADATLLFMLQSKALDPAALAWPALAQLRFLAERPLQGDPRWQDHDAWGTFFAEPPSTDASVAAFREWTVRRAAALPPQLEFRQAVVTDGGAAHVLAFPSVASVTLDTATRNALQTRGLTQANVLPVPLSQPGQRASEVIAVLPAARETFDLPMPPGGKAVYELRPGEAEAGATVRVLLHPVDATPLLPGLTLLRLEPVSESLYAGDRQVATRTLPPLPWPAPSQAPPPPPRVQTAAERFAGGTFGPDVVGLRLGMPADEAEAALRKSMQVGREFVTQDPQPGQTRPPAWLSARLFETTDGAEKVAVFRNAAGGPARVVGLWRQFAVPTTPVVVDQAKDAMKAKYGPPTADRGLQIIWAGQPAPPNACLEGWLMDWDWRLVDTPGRMNPAERPTVMIAYDPQGTPFDYNRCAPLLGARFGAVPTTFDGPKRTSVTTTLTDLGVMQWLAAQPFTAAPAPPPPPMKF